MKHQIVGRKFGRESHQRVALIRSLCTSLVKYERIETTLQKAKDLRKVIERAVTMAKKQKDTTQINPELATFFHASHDKEIIGRDDIKRYLSNLKKDEREKLEKFLADPAKNEKPEVVLEYLASAGERAKGPRILRLEGVLTKLIKRIAPRFKDTAGGYTRIYKVGPRRGDSAEMAIIEFTK